MDRTATRPTTCPHCSARVGPGDDWCSLCHFALGERPAAPGPLPAGTGDGPSGRPSSGGAVPEDVGEVLAAGLREDELRDGDPSLPMIPWRRPLVAGLVGSLCLTAALLLAMTVIGNLL